MDIKCETNKNSYFDLKSSCKKYVFINFWATWCYFCLKEFSDLQKICLSYDKDVDFIFINCGEDKNVVDDFITKNGYTFTVGYDCDRKITDLFGVTSIPRTLIINKNSEVFEDIIGAKNFKEWENILKNLT